MRRDSAGQIKLHTIEFYVIFHPCSHYLPFHPTPTLTEKAMQVLYTAHATATGGRDGRAVSDDKHLDVPLNTPRELGGAGGEGFLELYWRPPGARARKLVLPEALQPWEAAAP